LGDFEEQTDEAAPAVMLIARFDGDVDQFEAGV
jgi:hypothetical protein